jgi:hypothetical protein
MRRSALTTSQTVTSQVRRLWCVVINIIMLPTQASCYPFNQAPASTPGGLVCVQLSQAKWHNCVEASASDGCCRAVVTQGSWTGCRVQGKRVSRALCSPRAMTLLSSRSIRLTYWAYPLTYLRLCMLIASPAHCADEGIPDLLVDCHHQPRPIAHLNHLQPTLAELCLYCTLQTRASLTCNHDLLNQLRSPQPT